MDPSLPNHLRTLPLLFLEMLPEVEALYSSLPPPKAMSVALSAAAEAVVEAICMDIRTPAVRLRRRDRPAADEFGLVKCATTSRLDIITEYGPAKGAKPFSKEAYKVR